MCLLAQLQQQLHDFRLDGHVERGGRLVGNDHVRVEQQGDGDDDALTHAARQLVRVLVQTPLGRGNVDLAQLVERDLAGIATADAAVRLEAFDHLLADGQHRVERHHRVLEDHRDLVATHLLQLPRFHGGQLAAVETDAAAGDVARLGDQVENRECGHRLAGTGFADDPQAFTAIQREADTTQRLDFALAQGEAHIEIGNFE